MKNTCLFILLYFVLFSCSPTSEAGPQKKKVEQTGTIQKIAGYDVSHLGLLADDFDLPYQKISGRMLLWLAAESCDNLCWRSSLAGGFRVNLLRRQ